MRLITITCIGTYDLVYLLLIKKIIITDSSYITQIISSYILKMKVKYNLYGYHIVGISYSPLKKKAIIILKW